MTTKLWLRLVVKASSTLKGVALLCTAALFLAGCAEAPRMENPPLSHLVSSDFLNFTINYEMTDEETKADAISFKWSKQGFPIFHHPLYEDAEYWHKAVGWMDWNATATWWQFQVFDQKHRPICVKKWSEVKSDGEDSLTCSGVLKDNNQYVTLQLDYVLHGKPGPGANYLTSSHTLRLVRKD
jgi:hypothetical protein